jgi:hypothetical protein
MDTENDPRTSEVVLNSAITLGIAGENMADPVGLKSIALIATSHT